MTAIMTAAERREAYDFDGFEFGAGDLDWDYAQWLVELVQTRFERIEVLVGSDTAAEPLRQLILPSYEYGGGSSDGAALAWRDMIDSVFEVGIGLPVAQKLDDALLYGHYGVTPEDVPLAARPEWITKLVSDVDALAAWEEVVALNNGNNALLRIANLARSRHAIDMGRGDVDIQSMAVLGGITEGRVRNLLSGTDSSLERSPNGGIVAMSAHAWLQKKKGYLASIWQEEELSEEEPEVGPAIPASGMIFVPVARDGSMFTPDLKRNSTYRIGAKGEEEGVANFEDALARLNAMPVPRWRRPNEKGLWGIVSGVAWQRIEKK